MITAFHPRAIASALFMIVVLLMPVPGLAQTADAPAADEADAMAAPEADEGLPYPAGLDDPEIDLEALQLRLLPLTVDELAPLAEAWRGNARTATQALVERLLENRAAKSGSTDARYEARTELLSQRRAIFDRYDVVVSSLEAKGGNPEQVKDLRAYRNAIKVEETANLTPKEIAGNLRDWFLSRDGGVRFGLRLAIIAASLFGLLIVAKVVRRWAEALFRRIPNLSMLLRGFLTMVVYWLTIAVGLMIVLAALGVNITPLFALVGGATFIIAFAMQDTLGNLAAGLMIMINRPFDEGDYVAVAGVAGTVRKVSIVSTQVTTPDNQVIVIPNSKVWGDVITNVTASNTRRVDMVFGIAYEDSIEAAQKVLEKVVTAHPKVLSDPAPLIRVNQLAESSVGFIVRPWVRAEDYWSVYWDLTRQVKEAFDTHGLTIPFPQTEMRIKGGASDNAALAAPR